MKILMLNHEFPPVGGGAAPVTYELCRELAAGGHHVDVVTMHFKGLPRVEQVDGFTVYRTAAVRRRANISYPHELATFVPGAMGRVRRLVREHRYDIIHCHFLVPGSPLGWLASRWSGAPYVVTCHGTDVPGHNPDRFRLMHRLIKPAWRFLARRPAWIVSPSESLAGLIRRQCPQSRVRVIPNGMRCDRFMPGHKEKAILLCSRMIQHKGFQRVIEAVRDLENGWRMEVVGEGPYLETLRGMAEGAKMPIRFHGWLDQKDPEFRRLYESSSIFAFPSAAENFPTVLLEAMCAGMAVVTSTAGGCPEVVGSAGLLVEPGDVAGLRGHLLRLMEDDDLRLQRMQAALDRAKEFDWPRIAGRYTACYKEAAEGARRQRDAQEGTAP